MHKLVFAILFFVTASVNAQDTSCTSLRNSIYSSSSDKENLKPYIKELADAVSQKDSCARNLLGRMYAEGHYFAKDDDRAYAIFYELSNVGYAPAQYNLAFTLTQKQDVDPRLVFVYLQGLVLTYSMNEEFRYIVPKSIELGRQFLDKLKDTNNTQEPSLRNEFESVIRETSKGVATELSARTKALREKEDMIVGILAAGMLAYKLAPAVGNALSAPSYGGGTRFMQLPNPRFYQLYSPGGQGLYAVPIY
jgi:hypothetical protein